MSKRIIPQFLKDVILGTIMSAAIVSLLPLFLGMITDGQWILFNVACVAACVALGVVK